MATLFVSQRHSVSYSSAVLEVLRVWRFDEDHFAEHLQERKSGHWITIITPQHPGEFRRKYSNSLSQMLSWASAESTARGCYLGVSPLSTLNTLGKVKIYLQLTLHQAIVQRNIEGVMARAASHQIAWHIPHINFSGQPPMASATVRVSAHHFPFSSFAFWSY